ncbi:hypothetical protein [Xanthomonas fragariae]|uniref:hypothetical protein n=1 Tax=Xanthomonas fragariae TaxID=48664 RepID=UPI0011AB3A1F|nr:hypothetical protein [Xanthomonas fragariae]WIY72182.1 hypothetical protein OW158_18050 [Xanthomonas fragariae]
MRNSHTRCVYALHVWVALASHHITSHHITSHRNADADADAVKTVPDQHWLSSASGKTAPDGVDAMTI